MTSVAGIVATFNQREYIAEAVAGLALQCDEVVVVDDCSTDGTWDLLQALDLPNLRVLRNGSQSGVSATYNTAADATDCEVLLIQGGDDRSLPGRAADQAEALDHPEIALVYSLPTVIDSAGAELPDALASEFLVGATDPDPLSFLYFDSNYLCAPSVAVRRSDYRELGGFRRGIDLLQDYELWLKLAARGSFVRLERPVVEYRKHGSNLSREYTSLDAPRQRRLGAEMSFVRERFLDTSDAGTRLKLASAVGLPAAEFTELSARDQITVLQLSHTDRSVVARGLMALFDLVASGDDSQLAPFGLGYSDLSRFATIADVDNLAAIAGALNADSARRTALATRG